MTHFGTQLNAFFLRASFRLLQMLRVVEKTTAKILQVGDCIIRFAAPWLQSWPHPSISDGRLHH